jgi:hypothetical protein
MLFLLQPVYSFPSLSVDGSGSNACTGTSCSVLTFGTSNPNDVIIVFAATITGPSVTFSTPTDSQGHLSFTLRKSTPLPGSGVMNEWWAVATPALSGDTITVTDSGNSYIALHVWGISGANTASPFDSSAGVPATNSGTTPFCGSASCSVPISVTISSTSNSNDMVLGMAADNSFPNTLTAGSGFSLITVQAGGAVAEFKVVSTTQSGLSVPMTMTDISGEGGVNWSMIGDAVQAASTPPPPIPEYPLGLSLLAILLVIGYGLVRRRMNY